MVQRKTVRITNGDLEAYVMPQSVPVWERNGWTLGETGDNAPVDEPVAETPSATKPKEEQEDGTWPV